MSDIVQLLVRWEGRITLVSILEGSSSSIKAINTGYVSHVGIVLVISEEIILGEWHALCNNPLRSAPGSQSWYNECLLSFIEVCLRVL